MCAQTTWSLNTTTPTSCLGESHRFQVVCICAARHLKDIERSAWGRIQRIFFQGNPCLMPLSSLLWVFLAFTLPGRDASNHGCDYSGQKEYTQACGASQGLGEERKVGEKQASIFWFHFFFCLWVLNKSYTILFTASSLFSDFFFPTASGVAQKVTQDQPDISSQVGQSVTLNCRYETS